MWVLILSGVLGLISLLAFLFLLSLRKTFSIEGKHVLVRMQGALCLPADHTSPICRSLEAAVALASPLLQRQSREGQQ